MGSGSSLAPLLAECTAEGAEDLVAISTLRHPKMVWGQGVADQACFAEALGALWEKGCSIDWKAYHSGERYIKVKHTIKETVYACCACLRHKYLLIDRKMLAQLLSCLASCLPLS